MKIEITKLEAARRQLETAVELWFNDRDAVSIHTLACAARQIIFDLNEHRGGEPMGAKAMGFKPEHVDKIDRHLRKEQNFFKHADKDPEAALPFSTDATKFLLWEAIDRYEQMAGTLPPVITLYTMYSALHEPNSFPPKFVQALANLRPIKTVARLDKRQFLAEILPLFPGKGS